MHRNNPAARFRLLCLTFFISGVATAAEPSTESPVGPETDNVTIGQLEAAQAKNLLLEQKVQTARLQRQLRDSENGALTDAPVMTSPFPPAGNSPVFSPAPAPVAQSRAAAPVTTEPGRVRLQEIYGRGSNELRARISLPHGGVTEIRKGDQIPGTHQRVESISADAVRLSDGSELSF